MTGKHTPRALVRLVHRPPIRLGSINHHFVRHVQTLQSSPMVPSSASQSPTALSLTQQQQQQQIVRSMVIVSQHKVGDVPANASMDPIVTQTTTEQLEDDGVPVLPSNHDPAILENNTLLITQSCWKQMERLALKKNTPLDQVYLRVFVDAGGCSGFTYQFEFHTLADDTDEDTIDPAEDWIWKDAGSGAVVVVDHSSMEFLRGATLDYVVEMIKSSFEIRENPQSESACGCGSSFALKNFAANPATD